MRRTKPARMTTATYIGLVFGLFGLVSVVVAAVYAGRATGKHDGTAKVIQLLKEELDAVRTRANRLHDDLGEERKERRELEAKLVKLEALPDMTKLLEEMKAQREWAEQAMLQSATAQQRMFENHENRAQERHALIIESFVQLTTGLSEINKSLHAMNGAEQ